MKTIESIINETVNKSVWDDINGILKKTGWPKLEEDDDGKMKSIDEDTVITFELDEDNKPFISNITCNFVRMNPVHNRDLNGLIDLYEKMWTYYCSLD